MSTRFVSVDRNQPLLLPPDLREWVPEDDLVHFVIEAVAACFLHVLALAHELKLVKVGTVSVDGTTLKANASKNRNVRYDRAGELVEQLELEVHELMDQAERTDQRDEVDGQSLPEEIARRERLKAQLEQARRRLEERAQKNAQADQADYERKVKEREQRTGSAKGRHIKKPDPTPEAKAQENLTDPDSRLMRHNKRSPYEQAYNAQAAVDADGSQLVLSAHVSQCASDKNELVPAVQGIPEELGQPQTVLADNGYLNEDQVRTLEGHDDEPQMEVLVSVHAEAKQLRRKHDFRPRPNEEKKPPEIRSAFVREMQKKMARDQSREKYRLRKQTVEPVFGTIKKWMGFTQFLLRGHEKVTGEGQLVTLAYNMKRLWRIQCAPNTAK